MKRIFPIVATLFLLKCCPAWATDAQVYSLGEVVVSAKDTVTHPAPVAEITAEELELRNVPTLDKALELLPGVDVTRGGAGRPRVNVRGFRSRHTLLLLNGIPVNSTFDGQFDSGLVPTENIAKIKVTYGTHSVLYGQGGLAGVINIITKKGTQGVHGSADVQMDENGDPVTKATLALGKEKFNAFVSASHEDSNGFRLSRDFDATANEDGSIRENSDDRRTSFFGNVGAELTPKLEMGLTLGHSQGEYGVPPVTFTDGNFIKKAKFERAEDFETLYSQLSMKYQATDKVNIRAWGYVNQHEEDYARYDDGDFDSMTKKGSYKSENTTDIKGGTLQTEVRMDSAGTFTGRLDFQRDSYTAVGEMVEKNGDPAVAFDRDNELDTYSAALEYGITLFSGLDLKAGYGHHWQERKTGADDDRYDYMAGAGWQATDTTRVRGSYARKIRFPSIRQLYDVDSGNTGLIPEKSINYELGVTQELPWDMSLDVNVFQSDVDNYIEKNDATDKFENNDSYRFRGVDVQLAIPFLETGRLALGYALLDTEDKSSNAQKDELQYRPRHKVTCQADYTFGFGLTLHGDVMHVADQYYYSDSFDKGELDDYTLVNVKVQQTVYKEMVSIYLGADNLFDEEYEESYGLHQAGRTAYAGVQVRF